MSMLSSQADELRLMARLVRDYDYKEISRMLREAADTIESLRDRLQDAELGRGTCEWILEHSGTLYDKWRCSKCGYLYVESRVDHGIKDDFEPNYCPKCGCEVER